MWPGHRCADGSHVTDTRPGRVPTARSTSSRSPWQKLKLAPKSRPKKIRSARPRCRSSLRFSATFFEVMQRPRKTNKSLQPDLQRPRLAAMSGHLRAFHVWRHCGLRLASCWPRASRAGDPPLAKQHRGEALKAAWHRRVVCSYRGCARQFVETWRRTNDLIHQGRLPTISARELGEVLQIGRGRIGDRCAWRGNGSCPPLPGAWQPFAHTQRCWGRTVPRRT